MAVPYAYSMGLRSDEGVLITGVYGAGKSTVAAEISHLLEQRRQPYALLDLDFLGWGVNSFDDSAAGNSFMLRNLAAVVSNYREGGISVFVLAYFVSSHDVSRAGSGRLSGGRSPGRSPVGAAARYPTAPGGRRDHPTARGAAGPGPQIEDGEGVGVEGRWLANHRPVPAVAEQVMTWLGWT